MTLGCQHADEMLFQLVSGVIGADGDSRHPASLWLRRLPTQPAVVPWAAMALDPRAPVIIGVGQTVQHTDDLDEALDPSLLMCSAIGNATVDAGLRSIPNPQSLRVVNLLTWKYGDPAFNMAVVLATKTPPDRQNAGKYYDLAIQLGAERDDALEKLIAPPGAGGSR